MKYKVGDKVRLKEGLRCGEDYGDAFYVDGLDEYLGKDLTITHIHLGGDCYDFECDGKESYFAITDEMIEGTTLRLIDVLNMIVEGKFEKDWKVKNIKNEEVYSYYEDCGDIDLVDEYEIGIFENNFLDILVDEVEIIKPEEKEKKNLKEIDELRVQIIDSDGDFDADCVQVIVNKINELIYRFNSEVINK